MSQHKVSVSSSKSPLQGLQRQQWSIGTCHTAKDSSQDETSEKLLSSLLVTHREQRNHHTCCQHVAANWGYVH